MKQRLTGKWNSSRPTHVIHTGETGILEMFAESHGSMMQNYDFESHGSMMQNYDFE
jgi:hypothetical protein